MSNIAEEKQARGIIVCLVVPLLMTSTSVGLSSSERELTPYTQAFLPYQTIRAPFLS